MRELKRKIWNADNKLIHKKQSSISGNDNRGDLWDMNQTQLMKQNDASPSVSTFLSNLLLRLYNEGVVVTSAERISQMWQLFLRKSDSLTGCSLSDTQTLDV